MKKLMFFIEEQEVDEVEVKMYEISAKDDTFRYKIYPLKDKKGKYLLVVFCKDEDEAHRRGMWIRSKVFNNSKLYFVK